MVSTGPWRILGNSGAACRWRGRRFLLRRRCWPPGIRGSPQRGRPARRIRGPGRPARAAKPPVRCLCHALVLRAHFRVPALPLRRGQPARGVRVRETLRNCVGSLMAEPVAKHSGFNGVLRHEENLREILVFEPDCWHRDEFFIRKFSSP